MAQSSGAIARSSYTWFDFARWVAASLVVLEHLRDLFWIPSAEAHPSSLLYRGIYFLTGFGAEAVAVFFVLSGFWITKTVDRRIAVERFWRPYLWSRLSRLWIVLLPALVVGGLFDIIAYKGLNAPLHHGLTDTLSLAYDVGPRLTWSTFVGNVFFLQTIAVDTFGSNHPLWSLANEFWYYVWFPALALLVRKRRLTVPLLGLVIAAIAPHLLPGFVIWLFGGMLYHLDKRAVAAGERYPAWTLAAAGALLTLVLCASRSRLIVDTGAMILVGGAFALFAWALLRVDPQPSRAVKAFAHYGANSSFSLYVVHFPMLACLAAMLFHGRRMAPSVSALLSIAILFMLSTAWGWIFSRLTEAKTDRVRTVVERARAAGAPTAPVSSPSRD